MRMLRMEFLGLVLGFASACASGPAVTSQDLSLKRVVLYRNGIAYFEREGYVEGRKVAFKVRGDEVGDFLASFAVIEKGGGTVRAASFPLRREEGEGPAKSGGNDKSGMPNSKRHLETVTMELDGRDHELAVGYIAESPVWRPSYRLVLENDKAHLQVWGIVQNLSGEDWRNTRLSLIADAPLALDTQLEKAIIPGRPVLEEGENVIAVVPQSETSLAEEPVAPSPASMPAPAPVVMKSLRSESKKMAGLAAKESGRGASLRANKLDGDSASAGSPMEMQSLDRAAFRAGPSRSRNLAALAAVAVSGGATRYDLPGTVTVPDQSATMLLLLDKEIPGEATYLFAPDAGVPLSSAHPFRVARFTNKTGGLLERGPLAFFGQGSFLGQGVIEPLPDGASATVPFALESSLAIEKSVEYTQEGARLYQIEAGQLTIERQVGPRTRYTIRNGSDETKKLLLKHPRQAGARLVAPPKGTEDNVGSGSALIPAQARPHATEEQIVDERHPSRQNENWLSLLAEEAIKAYLAGPEGKSAASVQLREAWILREDWARQNEETTRLRMEQQGLEVSTEETRQNLRAIEKNKTAADLRQTLTKRLSQASGRLDEVTKRLIQLDLQIKELELRFQEALKTLKIGPRG